MLPKKQPLAEQIGETVGYVNQIIDRKIESAKISAAEKSATALSGIALGIILGIAGLMISVFGLVTVACWIAGAEQFVMGFGIVTSILIVLTLIIFLLRNTLIVNPAVKAVIGIFFSEKTKPAEQQEA